MYSYVHVCVGVRVRMFVYCLLCKGKYTKSLKPCLLDDLFPITTTRFIIHKLLPIRI